MDRAKSGTKASTADSWSCEGETPYGLPEAPAAEYGSRDMEGSENTFDVASLPAEQRLRLAVDPGTAPGLLQSLAQYYPPTRVAVAGNPAAYPALLHWLSGLGDPAVSAAVTARLHSPAPPPPPPPMGGFTPNAAPVGSGPGPVAPTAPTAPTGQGDPAGPTLGVPSGQPVMAAPKAKRRRLLAWGGVAGVVVVALVVGVVLFRTVTAPHSATHVAATITVGNNPWGMVVSPNGAVYVTNLGDGTVSVIKGDRVTTTISVGKAPGPMVVSPDGTVYVTNFDDGTVSVIKGDRVSTTIGVGRGPDSLAVSPAGTVYVTNSYDATVSVIKGDRVTTTISGLGTVPSGATMAPDGSVYVINTSDGTVSVITGDRVTTTISVGKAPVWYAMALDGSFYVASRSEGKISVIKGDRVTTSISFGASAGTAAVAPDGTVYVTSTVAAGDGTVSILR